jgi:uncharacterized damage-inducible protein DinB
VGSVVELFGALGQNPRMQDLSTIKTMLRYSDWANEQLIKTSAGVARNLLDQKFDIGMGTLRRTLLHILSGESVWLKRWKGERETPWPNEDECVAPSDILGRLREVFSDRERFLVATRPADLDQAIVYRDSKGSLFSATLGDMMIQMCVHSAHHRAQAVNIIRRLGAEAPELDYMMWVRKPA